MTTTALPSVGTIGLTPTAGSVGKLIKIGQWLNGSGFQDWEHAFLLGPDGKTLNAEPGGARIGHIADHQEIYWCRAVASQYSDAKLFDIWHDACEHYLGVGYSFLDYAALAAHRLHIPGAGLENYIKSTKHEICSQLCDQAYADQGCHLFDGVWPGYVTPLGLYNLDMQIRAVNAHHLGEFDWPKRVRPRRVVM